MKAVAEEFELGERLRDTVQELSLGTKRRIQVAKIFMLDAPVIILDEATTGMDPLMKRRVMDRLRAEARNGRTILLTTQVLSEAEELCETIMILDRGRTMASGTLQELRKLSTHMFRVNLSFARHQRRSGRAGSKRSSRSNCRSTATRSRWCFTARRRRCSAKLADISRDTPILQFEVRGPTLEEIFIEPDEGVEMTAIAAVFYRDYRQRMTNIGFVFWDLFVPLAYLMLFGLGFERMIGGGIAVEGTASATPHSCCPACSRW